MSWIRVDSNLHSHPRLRRAGPLAACVFEAVLRLVKEHGRGGVIAADCLTPEDVAVYMGWPGYDHDCDDLIGWVKRALDGLVTVGCVTPPDGSGKVSIPSWSKYQSDSTNADRQAAFRERARHDAASNALPNGSNANNANGTGRDGTGRNKEPLSGAPPPTTTAAVSEPPAPDDERRETTRNDEATKNGKPNGTHARAVLDYFNAVAGTKYSSPTYLKKIAERLREDATRPGITADDVVINAQCVIDEKLRQTTEQNGRGEPRFDLSYFTPDTLFRPTKYPKYLEEARKREKGQTP